MWLKQSPWRAGVMALAVAVFSAGAQAQAVDAHADIEAQVLDLINAQRAAAGLSALWMDMALDAAAEAHALDMATTPCFQHASCDGTLWSERVRSYYTAPAAIGEIIAAGYATPDAVVTAWMNSDGHRANILNPSFKVAGVALAESDLGYRSYWAVDFGGAVTSATVVPEPSTWALMGLGLLSLTLVRRKAAA